MTVRNIIFFLVIVGALIGGWLLIRTMPVQTPAPPEQGGEEQSRPVTPEGDQAYTEVTDLYTIDITYPAVANPAIQAGIEEIIEDQIAHFKAESVAIINEEEAQRIREFGRPYALIIDYKAYSHAAYVSYEFDIYLDTGGAHPNAFYQTATFNQAGERLELAELFIDGSAYLPRLSEEAYSRVLAMLEDRSGGVVPPDMEDAVRMGTSPSPEALQFFYLSNGDLHLLFPPYQVAAYAAGSFDIRIPLSELQDIVKPEVL